MLAIKTIYWHGSDICVGKPRLVLIAWSKSNWSALCEAAGKFIRENHTWTTYRELFGFAMMPRAVVRCWPDYIACTTTLRPQRKKFEKKIKRIRSDTTSRTFYCCRALWMWAAFLLSYHQLFVRPSRTSGF